MLLYLDLCAFNRPFDNQKQTRIHIETEAKLVIQEKIMMDEYRLVWSFILDYENQANPFEERRNAIKLWKNKAILDISETNEIIEIAKDHVFNGIGPKDALHLGCAQIAACNYLITTDDVLINKTRNNTNIKVINPVTFIEINDL
jgi:predicted nucleic acid-binding protein